MKGWRNNAHLGHSVSYMLLFKIMSLAMNIVSYCHKHYLNKNIEVLYYLRG